MRTRSGLVIPRSRSYSRGELVVACRAILHNDPWDDNAIRNAADKLAELLIELTGSVREGCDHQFAPTLRTAEQTGNPGGPMVTIECCEVCGFEKPVE